MSDKQYFVGRPNLGDKELFLRYVDQIFERNWLTNDGPLVQQFEQQIKLKTGAAHCAVTTNGTLALELAIRALDLKGEVLVPSFTFAATAHAAAWQGIKPVFVDCRPFSTEIDLEHAKSLLNENTTALLAVQVWGECGQMQEIQQFCHLHDLKLIYDAAHAFGCSTNQELISDQGDATVFSFHATKFLNSFEGGAVCTKDKNLDRRIRSMRNFGFAGEDNVEDIGTNAKMTEICAAMGLVNLNETDRIIEHNKKNYQHYQARLKVIEGVDLYQYQQTEQHNYQYAIALIDQANTGYSRDKLQEWLKQNNVFARRYFYPGVHRMKAYQPQNALTNVEKFSQTVLALPTGLFMERDDIDCVCDLIEKMPVYE